MIMKTATVSKKGWVVIPAELRKKYHLETATKLVFIDTDGTIALDPVPKDPIESGYGMLAGEGPSLLEDLLKERQWEREKEEAEIRFWHEMEK
jgi:AbrB family looped-hinge helix DNA binding protein